MKKSMLKQALVGFAIVLTIGYVGIQLLAEDGHKDHGGMHGAAKGHKAAPVANKQGSQVAHLAAALKALDAATKAVKSNDKKAALAELHKARSLVHETHKVLVAQNAKPKFANTSCPIMGMKLKPASVAKNLTRHYKGQTVAFCCGKCPSAWDGLTNAEKAAKLTKAGSKKAAGHGAMKH